MKHLFYIFREVFDIIKFEKQNKRNIVTCTIRYWKACQFTSTSPKESSNWLRLSRLQKKALVVLSFIAKVKGIKNSLLCKAKTGNIWCINAHFILQIFNWAGLIEMQSWLCGGNQKGWQVHTLEWFVQRLHMYIG